MEGGEERHSEGTERRAIVFDVVAVDVTAAAAAAVAVVVAFLDMYVPYSSL